MLGSCLHNPPGAKRLENCKWLRSCIFHFSVGQASAQGPPSPAPGGADVLGRCSAGLSIGFVLTFFMKTLQQPVVHTRTAWPLPRGRGSVWRSSEGPDFRGAYVLPVLITLGARAFLWLLRKQGAARTPNRRPGGPQRAEIGDYSPSFPV
jgi:hypothetical protein